MGIVSCSFTAPPRPFPPTQSSVRLSHEPSVLLHVSLSCDQSVRPPDSPNSLSITPPVSRTVCPSPNSPSVIPARPSSEPSVHPPVTPSMTCPSATPPVSHAQRPSDRPSPSDRLYTILPRLSGCPTSPLCTTHQPVRQSIRHHPTVSTTPPPVRQTIRHRPNVCTTTPPVCQTIRHHHTVCTPHQSVRQPVRHQPTV